MDFATSSSVIAARGVAAVVVPRPVLDRCQASCHSVVRLLMGRVGVVARRGKEKHSISSLDLSCYTVQLRLRMRLTSGGGILPLIPGLVLNARGARL